MAIIRNLWSMVRGPGGAQRFALAGCPVEQVPAIDFEHPTVPAPDPALLRSAGEKLLRAARARRQAPAMAVMQIDDLPEVEVVFGRTAADRVIDAVMAELTRVAVGKGLVVRTAADTVTLLMPGGGAGATIAAIQARFGKPCTIEVGSGRNEILAVPDVMVHPLGPQDSIAQVYEDLCRYIAKARRHGRRVHDGVPQRAAPGSLEAGSRAVAAAGARAPQYCPSWPATIPVPLALH